MCETWTGLASTASPLAAARVLISFINPHGNVSSWPKRIPIFFFDIEGSFGFGTFRNRISTYTHGVKRSHAAWYSSGLSRTMELLWFGDRGRPVLIFPTSKGRF